MLTVSGYETTISLVRVHCRSEADERGRSESAFLCSPRCPSSLSFINEYPAIDGGVYVSE